MASNSPVVEKEDPSSTPAHDNHAATTTTEEAKSPVAEHDPEKTQPVAPSGPAGPGAPGAFPDGGKQAWSVVFGGWCCMFTSLGWINCIGIMQTEYEREQLSNYSPSSIAWILSVQTFFMFGGAPFFGKIFDSFGPRLMLPISTVFHVFGLMMVSLGKPGKYYQFFLAQSICSGIAASGVYYSATNSTSTWFQKKRAKALGLASSGSAFGGVIIPIVFSNVLRRAGFGWAMRAVAFIYLGLLSVGIVFVRSRLPPNPKPWKITDFTDPLKELRFTLVVIANFMFFFAAFLPTNFVILQALHEGMSVRLAGYLLSILNSTSFFGRILAGMLADKIGRFNAIIIATAGSAVFTLGLWLPSHTNAEIIVYAAIIGFTAGAFVAMVPACIAQISDIKKIGVRNGTNFAFVSLAALIGNPVAGALVDRDNGGFRYLQIFTGVAMCVSICFFVAARAVQVGMHPLRKV